MAEGGQDLLGHPEGVRKVAHVGPDGEAAATQLLDLAGDLEGPFLARHVVDGDVSALLGEGEGDGTPDPA